MPSIDSKMHHDKELESEAVMAEKASDNSDHASMEWNELDEKRIRERMDWRIVPTVFVLYLLCFIDSYDAFESCFDMMNADILSTEPT